MTATVHALNNYGGAAQSGAVVVSEPRVSLGIVNPFTPEEARAHTDRTYAVLRNAYELVCTAYDRQAWKTCLWYDDDDTEHQGYPSWGAYLRAEFDGLRVVRLDNDEQAATIIAMCREQGESYAEIAKLMGKSVGYVHKYDPTAGTDGITVGADGKQRQKSTGRKPKHAASEPAEVPADDIDGDEAPETTTGRQVRLIDRVVAYVRAHDGCTSADVKRAPEFRGKGHQRISAALSRAADPVQGPKRLRYETPDKRGQFGRYWWVDPASLTAEVADCWREPKCASIDECKLHPRCDVDDTVPEWLQGDADE